MYKYIGLNEVIKVNYFINSGPPDCYFSDLGGRALLHGEAMQMFIDTLTLVRFLDLWGVKTFRVGDSHFFTGPLPAQESPTPGISLWQGQIN